jgi:hypothetical protein
MNETNNVTVLEFNKETTPKYVLESETVLDEALNKMGLGDFFHNAITIFSDQVTSVCTKTGALLFDLEKGKIIRNQLAHTFDTVIEVIDDELKEHEFPKEPIQESIVSYCSFCRTDTYKKEGNCLACGGTYKNL